VSRARRLNCWKRNQVASEIVHGSFTPGMHDTLQPSSAAMAKTAPDFIAGTAWMVVDTSYKYHTN
jgi:hypothetical protein